MNDNLKLENYVTVIKNNSPSYSPEDIVNICKRRNNAKRDFLFVNSLQGKHLHIEPYKVFSLYDELVFQIQNSIKATEKVVVIGFAETATAFSNYISAKLDNCIYYMQTTREAVTNAKLILEFKEEHSHATEQLLYGDITELTKCDRIIFVDDEISTGNTILNFIHELELLGIKSKFSVASFLNWQNDEWSAKFKQLGIDCFYLLRGKLKNLNAKVLIDKISTEDSYEPVKDLVETIVIKNHFSNFTLERIGKKPEDFSSFENMVYLKMISAINRILPERNESVLVLGTEEYMYTPLVFANLLYLRLGANVQFHATTRSPIEASKHPSYAIKSRYPIASCYDAKRNTFIYNLQKYDKVFIVTDIVPNKEFIQDISSALNSVGCKTSNIKIIVLKG